MNSISLPSLLLDVQSSGRFAGTIASVDTLIFGFKGGFVGIFVCESILGKLDYCCRLWVLSEGILWDFLLALLILMLAPF